MAGFLSIPAEGAIQPQGKGFCYCEVRREVVQPVLFLQLYVFVPSYCSFSVFFFFFLSLFPAMILFLIKRSVF